MFTFISQTLLADARQFMRNLNLKISRHPGAVIFQSGMSFQSSHGYIWVAGPRDSTTSLKIGFRCENPAGVHKNLPTTQEEIVRQARQAGFEPIYLCMMSKHGESRERTIDPLFGAL